jgi:glutamate dehydrogenase (NAD(P)+)
VTRTWTVDRPDEGVRGWLVVDTLRGGLAFGGTRFTPDLTQAEVSELARCMTWKLAAHGLPTGGAKAGLAVDPADPALPRKLRVFGEALREPLTSCAVIGKDLGATDAMLDTIYAALGVDQLHLIQATQPACPARLRDLPGYRQAMTGQGVAWATRALLGADALRGARVAVQGAGVVGLGSARRLEELGATTVAMSDARRSVLTPGGAPWRTLAAAAPGGRIHGLPTSHEAAQASTRDAALHVDCDILVLAARSHSVDAALAAGIRAGVVVEGANFGLTDAARDQLAARGVVVLPDVLANSAAAAMTTRQLAAGGELDDETLWRDIEAAIDGAVRRAAAHARIHGGSLRAASLAVARQAGTWGATGAAGSAG